MVTKIQVVLGANIPGFENVMNTARLPARGATLLALPAKMKDASGAPARIIAVGWNGPDDKCRFDYNTATNINTSTIFTLCLLFFALRYHNAYTE